MQVLVNKLKNKLVSMHTDNNTVATCTCMNHAALTRCQPIHIHACARGITATMHVQYELTWWNTAGHHGVVISISGVNCYSGCRHSKNHVRFPIHSFDTGIRILHVLCHRAHTTCVDRHKDSLHITTSYS